MGFILQSIHGLEINKWMVRNGYAIAYKKYSKKYLEFENLQKNKKGIWRYEI